MGLLLNLSLDHQFKSGQNSPEIKKPSKEGEIKKKKPHEELQWRSRSPRTDRRGIDVPCKEQNNKSTE